MPEAEGENGAEHEADPPDGFARLQWLAENPPAEPECETVTVPVGADGPGPVSLTVTVQVES